MLTKTSSKVEISVEKRGNSFYAYRYPDCTTQPAFTGELLEKPHKMILMMIVSFEMATKEQQDLVDKIFLVEASATHKGVSDLVVHALSQAEGSRLMV